MPVMIALRKLWIFIKNYWWIPAGIIAAVVLYFVFRPGSNKLLELIQDTNERHKKEIADLERVNREESSAKSDAYEERDDRIKKIEEKHDERLEEIEENVARRENDLAAEDPEELTRELADRLNLDVIGDDDE